VLQIGVGLDQVALELGTAVRLSGERAQARERRAVDFLLRGAPCPTSKSRSALRRVRPDTEPRFGLGRSTPARLAFDRPMAMACLAERAP